MTKYAGNEILDSSQAMIGDVSKAAAGELQQCYSGADP